MIVWGVPRERLKEVAGVISASPFVSHCYARKAQPSWPYNLYAMVHATADEECGKIAADLSLALGIHDYRLLFTVREFKKVSPQYFGQRSSEETSL